MRIAATYENGEIFQHFGHTESFKIYEIQDNKVISSEIISSNGSGHGALAALLGDNAVDVIICGGIGGGAQSALEAQGIELCAGASGNADEAVEAYLRGELINTGANCDHHLTPEQIVTIMEKVIHAAIMKEITAVIPVRETAVTAAEDAVRKLWARM